MFVRVFLFALLIGAAGVANAQDKPASAQQPAAVQLTPEQHAVMQKQNEALVGYANQIVAMIDNGQIGQVWDQASDVAKKSVTRDQFIKTTQADRGKFGTMKSRNVVRVTRTASKGGKLPEGMYINVNFATQFSKQAAPVRELVSFHLDSDKKWRLSGYNLQEMKTPPRQ